MFWAHHEKTIGKFMRPPFKTQIKLDTINIQAYIPSIVILKGFDSMRLWASKASIASVLLLFIAGVHGSAVIHTLAYDYFHPDGNENDLRNDANWLNSSVPEQIHNTTPSTENESDNCPICSFFEQFQPDKPTVVACNISMQPIHLAVHEPVVQLQLAFSNVFHSRAPPCT
jgi:hypothetical protein